MKHAAASVVSIVEESIEGELWVLKSSNLPGLVLHGADLDQIRRSVPRAITGLFKLNYDVDVTTFPVVEPRNLTNQLSDAENAFSAKWAVIPASG